MMFYHADFVFISVALYAWTVSSRQIQVEEAPFRKSWTRPSLYRCNTGTSSIYIMTYPHPLSYLLERQHLFRKQVQSFLNKMVLAFYFIIGHKKHCLKLPKVDRGREPWGWLWHNVKLDWPLCTVILITG